VRAFSWYAFSTSPFLRLLNACRIWSEPCTANVDQRPISGGWASSTRKCHFKCLLGHLTCCSTLLLYIPERSWAVQQVGLELSVYACGAATRFSAAAFVLLMHTCGRWCDLRLGLALCCAWPISSSLSSSSGPMSSLSYRAMRAVMWPDLLLLLMGPPPPHRVCKCEYRYVSELK
jgi:hypothetical protein